MVSVITRPLFTNPVPFVQEAGWAPGPVWTGGKSRPIGIRSPDRPARSQSLYRPSYRGPVDKIYLLHIANAISNKVKVKVTLEQVNKAQRGVEL